jgi:hypothetical protein
MLNLIIAAAKAPPESAAPTPASSSSPVVSAASSVSVSKLPPSAQRATKVASEAWARRKHVYSSSPVFHFM